MAFCLKVFLDSVDMVSRLLARGLVTRQYPTDVRQPGPETLLEMESQRCRLPGLVTQVGPDDRQSNYPGDMSSMPARSAHRAAQPWATTQINPSATSVPCLFPAGTTPGSSSVPWTLDSATPILAVFFSSLLWSLGLGHDGGVGR